MRRQTATSGINPAGSGRVLRLDPFSLPVSFNALDMRADGCVRRVELHRERVVLRRALSGMRMAVNIRVSDFLGVALLSIEDGEMLVLRHRDPSLTIPIFISSDRDDIRLARQIWSEILALPILRDETTRAPAPRRRRRNAIRARRPKFLVRRRAGSLLSPANVYRGEREMVARD